MSTLVANNISCQELQSNGIVYRNLLSLDDASAYNGNIEVQWDPDKFVFIEVDFFLVPLGNNDIVMARVGQGTPEAGANYSYNQKYLSITATPGTEGSSGNTAQTYFFIAGSASDHADQGTAGNLRIYLHKGGPTTFYYNGVYENFNDVNYLLSNSGTVPSQRPDTLSIGTATQGGFNQGYCYVRGMGFA